MLKASLSNFSSNFPSNCIILFIGCFYFLVLKKLYFHHSLMDIHQICPSFQMCSLHSPLSNKKQSWYRGRVSEYGSRGPGFYSCSLLFSFFTFWKWKSKKVHQMMMKSFFIIWCKRTKIWWMFIEICRIFIKQIVEILLISMKFHQILMEIHQIEMNLQQRMTNCRHSFKSVVSTWGEVHFTFSPIWRHISVIETSRVGK